MQKHKCTNAKTGTYKHIESAQTQHKDFHFHHLGVPGPLAKRETGVPGDGGGRKESGLQE